MNKNFQIRIRGKICNFASLYHSPSQSQDDFEALRIIFNYILTQLQPVTLF